MDDLEQRDLLHAGHAKYTRSAAERDLGLQPRHAGCSASGAILRPHFIGAREPPLGCCSSSLAQMAQEFPIGAQDAQFAEPIHVVLSRKMMEPQALNLPTEAWRRLAFLSDELAHQRDAL